MKRIYIVKAWPTDGSAPWLVCAFYTELDAREFIHEIGTCEESLTITEIALYE